MGELPPSLAAAAAHEQAACAPGPINSLVTFLCEGRAALAGGRGGRAGLLPPA